MREPDRPRNPTIKDVAREAGVSHMTVSRVFSGMDYVAEPTRNRVLSAAASLSYTPNRAARALVTGRTGLIGIWVEDLGAPDFVSIMSHAVERLRGQALDPVVRAMQYGERSLQSVAAWQVDGILAVEGVRFINRLLNAGLSVRPPMVSLGAYPSARVDHVRVDLRVGTREALQHLLDQGCRRIALVTNRWIYRAGEQRYDAYTLAIEQAGLQPEYLVGEDDDRATARTLVQEHVRAHGCPDALFCVHDGLAIGAYRGLADLGVRVPDDCALVGCDGLEDTEYFDPPISTVVPPVDEMCTAAWRFLEGRIACPTRPLQHATLPARLVVRASSQL